MVIFETSLFTKKIGTVLNDEEYRVLQNVLVEMPGSGDIIQGSGGIRKIRWGASGRGKRGGARVIYYCIIGQPSMTKYSCFTLTQKMSVMI